MLTRKMSPINMSLSLLLERHPHILIAGTTGSGKSVCLNSLMYSLLVEGCLNFALVASKLECGEDPTREDHNAIQSFTFIDVKRKELEQYKGLWGTQHYVTEPEDVPAVLDEVIAEMEDRYKRMTGRKYVGEYHYVVIDELADLVNSENKKLNNLILSKLVRIGRLGRAANIKIIGCSQDPSRNTLSSQLMQNFPCSIALRCRSDIESRQIIGVSGAENIREYGRALVNWNMGLSELRFGMVKDEEIDEVVKSYNELAAYIGEILRKPTLWERITGKKILKPEVAEEGYFDSLARAIKNFFDAVSYTHEIAIE